MSSATTNKQSILVLFGGVSTEHDISCISAVYAIDNLNPARYNVHRVGITQDGKWWYYKGESSRISDGSWKNDSGNLIPAVVSPCSAHHGIILFDKAKHTYETIYIDAVFPVMHGKNGEDGTMQGLFTLAGIPFVGCSHYSSAVCMDKASAKIICESGGIPTAPYILLRKDGCDIESEAKKAIEAFGLPLFVKPVCSGSSVGITKAHCLDELVTGIGHAFGHDSKVLVEKAVSGKEIEVAVLGGADTVISECGEIEPCADFYDYQTKYVSDSAKAFIPARIPEEVSERVRSLAGRIFACLDCTGLSRVDFFVDGESIVFNEINTIPGFTAISMYPKLMAKAGYCGEKLLDALITSALEGKQ